MYRAATICAFLLASLVAGNARAQSCDPPRILLVMDASSSMLKEISDGTTTTTKWQAVRDAVQAVFAAHANAAQFGLMTFPGPAGGCNTGSVLVDVAAGTSTDIESNLASLQIPADNQTPAGQSLTAASQYAGITQAGVPNYVIFMTDGWQFCDIDTAGAPVCTTSSDCTLMGVSTCPSCNSCQPGTSDPACAGANADGCYCVRSWPVLGVEALWNAGVPTYVVGFGSLTDSLTLNRAAEAGGTALAGCDPNSASPSCYLQATSPTELTDALASIVQTVVTEVCSGPCGIEGTRTCTGSGWSACDAPDWQSCTTACGDGVQYCDNGVLGPCEATCPDAGAGGMAGAGGVGGMAGAGGTAAGGSAGSAAAGGDPGNVGGSAGASPGADAGTGIGQDGGPTAGGPGSQSRRYMEDEGSCGCRAPGTDQRGSHPVWMAGLLAGLLLRRRRSPQQRQGSRRA